MQENSVFAVLNAVDCSEHVEKKGKLSYLSNSNTRFRHPPFWYRYTRSA
jgi:hypothetical protein